eukprot:CAMPEP_0206444642 /NCGR_PEP_ID=MMETSP0324_2-20121206/15028_1 /ASSEMBLY_ACC=CAM_ASM_000836 /TAXON_ID=2866 /ORGANISM="Crypthecodinium cohnii, Strain Seligo" /LENGTH=548 /DNA_ID=CAMNT_0053912693 /DNA_START=189 /DNA_END=1835 /DNA_ORIENTATION=+
MRQFSLRNVFLLLCWVLLAAAEEESKKEELEVEEAANAGMSIMLLGSIAFMMGLFYLVNHPDPDMTKYSWQVISSTISIFSAVLLFQAINSMVEHALLDGADETREMVIGIAHFLVWYCLLQYTLAFFSGALHKNVSENDFERAECQLKCYAILLGHITGFAAINAFGNIQQMVSSSPAAAFAMVPISWLIIFMITQVADRIRDSYARGDDGIVDKFETLWDEVTEETEDDVIGLAVSFLAAQAFRFWVGGILPNEEGEEPEESQSSHSNSQVLVLYAIGIILVGLDFLRMLYIKQTLPRLTPQLRNIIMMVFSWCLYFGMDWWLSGNVFVENHGMTKEVVLALMVTGTAMSLIFVVDKIADLESTGESVDNALRAVVQALGILIGFGWEKSFDTAVAEVSEWTRVIPESVTKLVLALLIVLLVVPAWRLYILPTIVLYEKMEEEEEREEKEEFDEARTRALESGKTLEEFEALEVPLLTRERSSKKSHLIKPISGLEAVELQRKVKAYEEQIASLEEKNRGLEASLQEFVAELNELQQMADDLKQPA